MDGVDKLEHAPTRETLPLRFEPPVGFYVSPITIMLAISLL